MKYIDAEKLKAKVKKLNLVTKTYEEQVAFNNALAMVVEIIDSLQQEQPEEICSKCIHHGKDDGYCYNPHGGMQSLINENGVYECTGFCEQEQPEVDLEKEINACWQNWLSPSNQKEIEGVLPKTEFTMYARHFYELGLKRKKGEII